MKFRVFSVVLSLLFFQVLTAQVENKEEIGKAESDLMKKEAKEKVNKVSEIEKSLDKLNKDAVKEKDIKWKVCLDNYIGTLKGVAASAINAGTKIPELVEAGKFDDAKSQLILLRGLTDSAEKTLSESQSCERQLTSVNADSNTIKEVNKKVTGSVSEDSVNDALGVGFDSEFVTETDKSVVSGSDLADAGGVDSSDVNIDSPGSSGENSSSENETLGYIEKPEIIDASPTN